MPAPSQLAIATSTLNRVVKEEASYHKEFELQQASIAKLEQQGPEAGDENAEYTLRQERKGLEETKALFPQLRTNIEDALSKLEQQLDNDHGDKTSPEDISKAKGAVAAARSALQETTQL